LAVSVTVLTVVNMVHDSTDLVGLEAGPRRLRDSDSGYFADPLIDQPYKSASNKYWIFIHIIVIAYMLLGLNTVCDLYFTGALDEMVNKWDIKPDVAGATFMAAGGSAPELFTSLIGAAISESDVGFGTIVGSAVFNVLFVIGLCGFTAQVPIKLTWWPLFRDCTYYILGLCMLAIFAKTDGSIALWEAFILFLGYLGYCVLMYYNQKLEDKFVTKNAVVDLTPVTPVTPTPTQHEPGGIIADTGSTASTLIGASESEPEIPSLPSSSSTEERHHIRKTQPHFERKGTIGHGHEKCSKQRPPSKDHVCLVEFEHHDHPHPSQEKTSAQKVPEPENDHPPMLPISDEDTEDDDEGDDIDALLEMPEGGLPQAIWFACLPIYFALFYGIPKPSERCCMATFAISLIWIAGFSFWLVYCVEVLGGILGIHIIIMGFTLLAAGTSIPDLVSSMAVARAGEGDMAVSSSIGSNIFDILVGLPIPWIIKILFIEMMAKGREEVDSRVKIISHYIVVYVIILIVMVFCVIVSIHSLGWYLNKTLGIGMAALYATFLALVLTVEFSEPEALKF
jgi:sodium/potassium/calcium exchanger 2